MSVKQAFRTKVLLVNLAFFMCHEPLMPQSRCSKIGQIICRHSPNRFFFSICFKITWLHQKTRCSRVSPDCLGILRYYWKWDLAFVRTILALFIGYRLCCRLLQHSMIRWLDGPIPRCWFGRLARISFPAGYFSWDFMDSLGFQGSRVWKRVAAFADETMPYINRYSIPAGWHFIDSHGSDFHEI